MSNWIRLAALALPNPGTSGSWSRRFAEGIEALGSFQGSTVGELDGRGSWLGQVWRAMDPRPDTRAGSWVSQLVSAGGRELYEDTVEAVEAAAEPDGGLENNGAIFDFDFTSGRYWQGSEQTPSQVLTCSRASPAIAYAPDLNGLYLPFAANEPRIVPGRGLLTELAKTNVVLWCRDLTNAAWTKTNMTAAKDQAGVDGVANSASTITATAANATVLQAITLASSARMQSAFVKRLVGSGTIEMTMNGGTTWTAVTVTAGWTRVRLSTATLANPSVGFRLATSGDSIAVDFVQNENDNLNPSTPIYTEGAAVLRNIDWVRLADDSQIQLAAGTMWVEYEELIAPTSILGWIFNIRIDGNNAIRVGRGTTHKFFFTGDRSSGGSTNFQLNPTNNVAAGNIYRAACAWQANDVAAAWQQSLETTIKTDLVFTPAVGTFDVHFGSNGVGTEGGNALNGFIRRVAYAPTRRPDSDLTDFAWAA